MKKYILNIILILICTDLSAQINLVQDPSMEGSGKEYHYSEYPNCDSSIYYNYWSIPLGSPGDFNSYYDICSYLQGSAGTPKNQFGYAKPVDGEGYWGLGLGADYNACGHPDWLNYEYIEGVLSQPLIQGKEYCVSFYVRLADSSTHSTYCVGAYLSKDFIPDVTQLYDTVSNYYLHYTPQIQNPAGNFLVDTVWHKIEGSFVADGGEKYITIGNFCDKDISHYQVHENIDPYENSFCGAFYYVDMVSVYLCNDTIKPEPVPEQKNIVYIPNVFSPNSDGANDILYVRGEKIKELTLCIYNRWGEKVFTSNDINTGWDGNYKGKPCPSECYYYYANITFANGMIEQKKGSVTLVR